MEPAPVALRQFMQKGEMIAALHRALAQEGIARRTRYRYLRQGGAALVALRGLTLGPSWTHPQCPTRKTTALANCLKLPFLSCTLWICVNHLAAVPSIVGGYSSWSHPCNGARCW